MILSMKAEEREKGRRGGGEEGRGIRERGKAGGGGEGMDGLTG